MDQRELRRTRQPHVWHHLAWGLADDRRPRRLAIPTPAAPLKTTTSDQNREGRSAPEHRTPSTDKRTYGASR
jgi:hypothetical protein